jgi:hypothetical protein
MPVDDFRYRLCVCSLNLAKGVNRAAADILNFGRLQRVWHASHGTLHEGDDFSFVRISPPLVQTPQRPARAIAEVMNDIFECCLHRLAVFSDCPRMPSSVKLSPWATRFEQLTSSTKGRFVT